MGYNDKGRCAYFFHKKTGMECTLAPLDYDACECKCCFGKTDNCIDWTMQSEYLRREDK